MVKMIKVKFAGNEIYSIIIIRKIRSFIPL